MLYFFCIENYFEENVKLTEAGRVLYYDVPVEQLRRGNEVQAKYNQCAITFELTYKLPELFIEDEADSDRFLQLLEELIRITTITIKCLASHSLYKKKCYMRRENIWE